MSSTDQEPETESTEAPGKGLDGRALAVAGVLLAACAGLVLYGVLDTEDDKATAPRSATAAVTYEVTGEGTADISFQAGSEAGTATVARAVDLPWKKTVEVPLGRPPLVSITLGEKGGRAICSLAVRGEHVQTASAYGKFGRATCQGQLVSATSTGPGAEVGGETGTAAE